MATRRERVNYPWLKPVGLSVEHTLEIPKPPTLPNPGHAEQGYSATLRPIEPVDTGGQPVLLRGSGLRIGTALDRSRASGVTPLQAAPCTDFPPIIPSGGGVSVSNVGALRRCPIPPLDESRGLLETVQ